MLLSLISQFIYLWSLTQFTSCLEGRSDAPVRKFEYSGMTFTNERYCPNVTMDSPVANDSLYHLSTTGANYVAIVVTQYQMNISSVDIFPVYDNPIRCTATPYGYCSTVPDMSLINTINNAHNLGLKVLLKPHIDLIDDAPHWRGEIGDDWSPTSPQWKLWFESYTTFILQYAEIANATDVELFSVSTELVTASNQDMQWRLLIRKIREVYNTPNGLLTDAANWSPPYSNNTGEFVTKKWWDLVDIIGCDEYYIQQNFAFINNSYPSMTELMILWQEIAFQLEYIHNLWNKPVIFTEIGYCSGVNGSCYANQDFANVDIPLPTNESLHAQTEQYEAMFLTMSEYEWFQGVFWWNWATDAAFGGYNDSCMDPKFKPTEQLLRKWYNATEDPPDVPDYPPSCRCWL